MESSPRTISAPKAIGRLVAAVSRCRDEALQLERRFARDLARIDPRHRPSARNLLHYLALRQRDMRPLQTQLAALGLSSLGRSEANTLAGLNAVLGALLRLAGTAVGPADRRRIMTKPPVDFVSGPRCL